MNVYDFAMKMELQGKACYENLASQTAVPGLKTILTALAADEQRHFDIFRALKEEREALMTGSRVLELAKSVFRELVGDRESIAGLHVDLEAYRFGLKIEADSVKLYQDLAQKEQYGDIRQIYLQLAEEEKQHFNVVENLCDFLSKPRNTLEWREFSNLHGL